MLIKALKRHIDQVDRILLLLMTILAGLWQNTQMLACTPQVQLDCDTHTPPDESNALFPHLLASLFEEQFSEIQGEKVDRYEMPCCTSAVSDAYKQTREQSISDMWH